MLFFYSSFLNDFCKIDCSDDQEAYDGERVVDAWISTAGGQKMG